MTTPILTQQPQSQSQVMQVRDADGRTQTIERVTDALLISIECIALPDSDDMLKEGQVWCILKNSSTAITDDATAAAAEVVKRWRVYDDDMESILEEYFAAIGGDQ